jgi:hypothetical protein
VTAISDSNIRNPGERITSVVTIDRLALLLIVGSIAILCGWYFSPVADKLQRLALPGASVGIWLGCLLVLRQRKFIRNILLLLPVLPVVLFSLPGRQTGVEEIRADYVKRLTGFEGTRYFWGGESHRGIDCSGLPRRALQDTLLADGLRHFNGRSLRMFFEQWWFDTSARALGEGYREFTIPLKTSGTIRGMSYSDLQPGDLAVTADGVHIIAYLGGDSWIQSDPGAGKVVILSGRTSDNSWFTIPVTTHRWRLMSSSAVE